MPRNTAKLCQTLPISSAHICLFKSSRATYSRPVPLCPFLSDPATWSEPFLPWVAISSQEPLPGCNPGCVMRGRRESKPRQGQIGFKPKYKKITIKRQRRGT
ncbi:hypothetical protein CgunFtcFv8_017701 [Champsocephalus gunnari]|uniref:Uncharacterized protein n=1 Tax=Champsocephalus gunnari TaxID=52237 RepID=A0AAN8DT07_CHAGU|nr:hypothetical protein CgunFtcFv8_017701 [Champsocephalus gunnari]